MAISLPNIIKKISFYSLISIFKIRPILLLIIVFLLMSNQTYSQCTLSVDAGTDQTVCAGTNAVLNATSSYSGNLISPIGTQDFSYTASDQTYSIPSNATYLKVELWGAGGGNAANYNGGPGAPGGYTESLIELPSGASSLTVVVGSGGAIGVNIADCYGGGGGSGNDGGASGGQGGGRSAIIINGNEILTWRRSPKCS